MSPRFAVLASGSSGNASLLQVDDFGLLIDAGLGPRELGRRLALIGAAWQSVHAVLLTHTHADHWKAGTLSRLLELRIPLYCHASHLRQFGSRCGALEGLRRAKLIRPFEQDTDLPITGNLRCRPMRLRHDGGATFGFRIERSAGLFGCRWAMGYAADLGCWDEPLAGAMSDVDLLAVEFNHDVALQQSSGRARWLIERVLGDDGHLSNEQAADLLRSVLRNSTRGRLRHVVQLHLSRDCNRPALAAGTAQTMLAEVAAAIGVHTAAQDRPTAVPACG